MLYLTHSSNCIESEDVINTNIEPLPSLVRWADRLPSIRLITDSDQRLGGSEFGGLDPELAGHVNLLAYDWRIIGVHKAG